MPQTFQQVLASELSDRKITQADRAHLERWVNEGRRHDGIWRRLKMLARLAEFCRVARPICR